MPFAALDDGFYSNPKVVKAGLDGAGLYARSLSYCADQLTDGFVHHAWAAEIAKPAVRAKVTAAKLWVEVTGGETFSYELENGNYTVTITERGYFIPDYVEFNPTRESVTAKREELSAKRSEAGKKGAIARWKRQRHPDSKPDDLPSQPDSKPMANTWQPDSPLTPNPEENPRDLASLHFDVTQSPTHYDHEGHEEKLWRRLCTAAHARTPADTQKLERTIRARHSTERDIHCAIEAATGPGVDDPLAVALAELVKRSEERAA